ncbi:ABC transporter ATP-binding protein [Butyricicoccus sp. AM42-5AC]|nr:ABC transporter ATP-binding protein [Butyricicoccus sp. AM42-5AC]
MVGSISISGVSKHFINPTGERITALDNVSLEIPSGSFVSLIGPSGCGKSTLLRLISGLIPMDEGELTLDGVPVTAPGADRGFMFQEHTLFPWLSIYDNIAFGLRARGIYKQEKDRVDEFIEMVGLKGFEHSYPHQLSGGMCQRASLARALVGRPKVLLLDEPLGALDAFTRMNMQDEILRIWKETGMTALMITHDVDEAVYLSDKVVVMTPRPGRITGTLDIRLSRPRAPAQSGRRSVRRTVHVFPLQKSESVKKALRIDLNCGELSFYAFGISGCTMQLFS